MPRTLPSAAVAIMWLLAITLALATAGYIVRLVPLLLVQVLVLARYPVWLRLHIACAAVALVAGPFQFVSSLRPLAFWSWVLNLVVAEWLVRRAQAPPSLLNPAVAR